MVDDDWDSEFSFGDTVRVRTVSLTQKLRLAGLVGCVFGMTQPSSSGVEVVGAPRTDLAVGVLFEERGEEHWFAEELLEFA